ncbi:hypothetical protein ACWFRJ_05200 [Streptomyces sp. NPDC055239]
MARPPQPRHITLGGRDAVALTPQEYERLIVSRQQIGGQSARVRVLAQQVKQTEELLREIALLVEQPTDACPGPHISADADADANADADADVAGASDSECLRCALAALLQRHRNGRSAGASGSGQTSLS